MRARSRSIEGVDEIFRRLSFGRNGGKTPNTSTAVAYGLILNYLDRSVDDRILPNVLKSEILQGSAWSTQRYPQTALLHDYLLRHCHLEPGPLGNWGKGLVRHLKRFWQADPWKMGVIVRSAFGGYGGWNSWKLIQQEIESNRPMMMATTDGRLRSKGEFCHTVVACGYRLTAFGQREILVHSGKYGDFIKGSRSRLLYVPISYVLCSYCFDVVLLSSALDKK